MTTSKNKLLRHLLILALLTISAVCCFAQSTFRTVATLQPWPNGVTLQGPLVRGPDGSYYGVTQGGGTYSVGTIFKLSPGGAFTLLASFNPASTGSVPKSLALGLDGNFYGVCLTGGTGVFNGFLGGNKGTIFKMTPEGMLSVLHTFSGLAGDGENPSKILQGADGFLYGLAQTFTQNSGTMEFFKISPTTATFTQLNTNLGVSPFLTFQGSDTFFYGTTLNALVRISTSGQVSTLAQLSGDSEFSEVVPGPNGTIYVSIATTTGGSIVRFNPMGNTTTSFATFGPSTLSAIPDGGIFSGTDGSIYGAGEIPGTSNCIIYKVTQAGVITPLFTVIGEFALFPILDPDGDLFWELFGGSSIQRLSHGSVTRPVNLQTTAVTRPTGSLLQASDRAFYGTGSLGGTGNFGGVYKVTAAGQKTDLGSFAQKVTLMGVIQATDGNFYGVASGTGGSPALNGIFFKVSVAGVMTTFPTTFPGVPGSPIVQGPDGNFYGLTNTGGAFNAGSFYQITPAGNFTAICSLDSTMSISGPYAVPLQQLVFGRDNNFYAATPVALLRIPGPPTTPSSVLTPPVKPVVLQGFSSAAGFGPTSLAVGPDGNIYGTSLFGGPTNEGLLFEVTKTGKYTVLQTFGLANNAVAGSIGLPINAESGGPTSLAFGNDNSIYVTANGGFGMDTSHRYLGVLLQIKLGHSINSLPFGSTAGDAPNSIIQGTDGTLYGTTSLGGTAVAYTGDVFSGTVFNVDPGLLRGTVIGTAGTYNIKAGNNTIANVFDGDVNSFFDAPSPGTGDWVGLDLGTPQVIAAIAFVPRTHYENRMIGGVFQGSNTADFSSGVVNLAPPITTYPGDRFNTITLSNNFGAFRYVRYLSPVKGFGNINELQFFSGPPSP